MKKIFYIALFSLTLGLVSCEKTFDSIKPLDMTSADVITSSVAGLERVLANLYYNTPIEDFNYRFNAGFNRRGWGGGMGDVSHIELFTDNAGRSSGTSMGSGNGSGYWPYTSIRTLNDYMENLLPKAKEKGTISEAEYNQMMSEAHFIRAYMYFGLAKRKGGVPLVTETLDKYYDGGESAGLFVPRSTEEATWDFVLAECDEAAKYLPESRSDFRATKWAALALKSRAALHAASVAKFWNNAPLSSASEAVKQNLVGFANPTSAASKYYDACISASNEIITKGGFALVGANPADAAEAAENYQSLFLLSGGAKNSEFIFGKAYAGETVGSSHSMNEYYSPHQASYGYHKDTRYSIMLDLVDAYEDLDSNGASAPVETRTDGNETSYVANPLNMTASDFAVYKRYAKPEDAFANKDPRFQATVLYYGSDFRGTKIVMQAGVLDKDGVPHIYTNDYVEGADGNNYYAFGAQSEVGASGFFGMDNSDNTNFSTSGFSLKKFLTTSTGAAKENGSGTTTYIDFRLAEIYLNYAEAVVESGKGDAALAKKYLNDIRHRAGLSGDVALNRENVRKERRVELALEGHRMWDLVRWREQHGDKKMRHALLPILDASGATPQYIFVRANWKYDEDNGGRTIGTSSYYQSIPNTNKNKLVPNTF